MASLAPIADFGESRTMFFVLLLIFEYYLISIKHWSTRCSVSMRGYKVSKNAASVVRSLLTQG